jgi:type VI secretion system protein ImpA
MIALQKQRVEIDYQKILEAFSNSSDPAGINLRYDPLYDKIRNARREEDDGMSRGIWQADLKHADWISVESLCFEVLSNNSKDLQVVCWLIEAWINLDYLGGMNQGYKLLNDFCQNFWDTMYPKLLEEDDVDYRIRIFEWLIKSTSDTLFNIPISNPDNSFIEKPLNLSGWNFSVNLEKISKRGSEGQRAAQDLVKKGNITIDKFRSFLLSVPKDFAKNQKDIALQVQEHIHNFTDFLDDKIQKHELSFRVVLQQIDDLIKIYDFILSKNVQDKSTEKPEDLGDDVDTLVLLSDIDDKEAKNNLNSSDNNNDGVVSNRKTAYIALKEIGEFLESLDPHSPTPHILKVLASWENKTLPQILVNIAQESMETKAIIKVLASGIDEARKG